MNDWVDFFEDFPEYDDSDLSSKKKGPALDREQVQHRKNERDEVQAMLDAALLQNPLKKVR
jgi:hypothetical protein